MPIYGKGYKITFTLEAGVELCGVCGIILKRRIKNRHYVYDIKITARSPISIPGINLVSGNIIKNVSASWFELPK